MVLYCSCGCVSPEIYYWETDTIPQFKGNTGTKFEILDGKWVHVLLGKTNTPCSGIVRDANLIPELSQPANKMCGCCHEVVREVWECETCGKVLCYLCSFTGENDERYCADHRIERDFK